MEYRWMKLELNINYSRCK